MSTDLEDQTKSDPPSDWTPPAPLAALTPRKVEMTGLAITLATIIVAPFVLALLAMMGMALETDYETRVLEKSGIHILGTVVRLVPAVTDRGRNNHGPIVVYIYEPKEYAQKPDRVIHTDKVVSPPAYRALKTGGTIPPVYDPAHPEQSELGSFVEAHRLGHGPQLLHPVLLLFILFPVGLTYMVLGGYFREKSLLRWGKAAKATIIGEVEYEIKGNVMRARVIYMFEDEGGITRQGEQEGLPTRDDPTERFYREREPFLANPTVVFDPRDSRRHMLYPGTRLARLAP